MENVNEGHATQGWSLKRKETIIYTHTFMYIYHTVFVQSNILNNVAENDGISNRFFFFNPFFRNSDVLWTWTLGIKHTILPPRDIYILYILKGLGKKVIERHRSNKGGIFDRRKLSHLGQNRIYSINVSSLYSLYETNVTL